MKKRINLFRFNTQIGPSPVVKKLEQYSMAAAMILFIIFLSINALFLVMRLRLNDYNQQKADLLSKVIANQDVSAQILYFAKKENQVGEFLKDDAQFLPYYNLMKDLLVFSSNSPVLKSMTLDKTKKTEFIVSFQTFDQAYQFLHFVESDSFLKNFLVLKLNKFALVEGSSSGATSAGYELNFQGQFKDLHETNI